MGTNGDSSCMAETSITKESNSHLSYIDEDDEPISFIARVQATAFSHVPFAVHSKKKLGDNIQNISVHIGADSGSCSGASQYHAYFRVAG